MIMADELFNYHYFKDYLSGSEGLLNITLQKQLSHWVNNSFTSDGELGEIYETNDKQNTNAAICLEPSERRDLLEMAVREFMSEVGQEKNLNTWIRSVYLLVRIDSEDNLWDLVREKGNLLKEVDWNQVLNSVLNLGLRESLADSLETSGAIRSAKRIRQNVLHQQKLLNDQLNTPESLRSVYLTLERIGDIEVAEGNLSSARTIFSESLEISKKLTEQFNTPLYLQDVSRYLDRIGDIEKAEGSLSSARAIFSESLEISRKLVEQLNTPESLRDLSFSLNRMGKIENAEGNLECAKGFYSESFEISRNLTDQFNIPDFINGKIWTLQQLTHVQILLEENQTAFNLLKENESDVDKLRSECSGDVNILDTVAAYWERRTEVEEKLKIPEAKNSKVKAEAIRNEIANKKEK